MSARLFCNNFPQKYHIQSRLFSKSKRKINPAQNTTLKANLQDQVPESLNQTPIASDNSANINRLFSAQTHYRIGNALHSKTKRQSITKSNLLRIPLDLKKDVANKIDEANSGHHILSIIQTNMDTINHTYIFNKAMKKCYHIRDWNSIIKIMDLALDSAIKPDYYVLGCFLKYMANGDYPDICIKYFDILTKPPYSVKPDVIIFSQLLKSFRMQGITKYAQRYWQLMKIKYEIEPDEMIYSEMLNVYGPAYDKQGATEIFNEYINKVDTKKLTVQLPVFNSYLNVFSRSGDIEGMTKVGNLIKEYGLEYSVITVADMMRGYHAARDIDGCLNILELWIESGRMPTASMLYLKCVALVHKIRENEMASFDIRYDIYKELQDTVYTKIQDGKKPNPLLQLQILEGAIFLYRFENPMEIVRVFEDLLQRKLIGYEAYDKVFQRYIIDLHRFQLWQAQFIMRYLIGLKCKELIESSLFDDKLWIIVGKGKHTDGGDREGKLMEFIATDLLSWNPPIYCEIYKPNPGCIYIEKRRLVPYLAEDNFARGRLTELSDDWYYADPREFKDNLHKNLKDATNS